MDSLGHLNNAIYFRFFEEGRVTWMSGLDHRPASERGEGFVLASVSCDFLRQVKWPETVTIETFVVSVGRSSVTLAQELRSARDASVLYATSESRVVWANFAEGRSRPLPAALRARLAAPPAGAGA